MWIYGRRQRRMYLLNDDLKFLCLTQSSVDTKTVCAYFVDLHTTSVVLLQWQEFATWSVAVFF